MVDFLEEYGQEELGFRDYSGPTPRKTVGNLNALDRLLAKPITVRSDTGERHARFYVPQAGYTQQKRVSSATAKQPKPTYLPPGPPVRWQVDPFSSAVQGLMESPVGVGAGLSVGERTPYVTTPILGAKIATAPITAANFATYIREGIPAALTAMQGFKYQQIPGQPYTPPPGPPEGERTPLDEAINFLNDVGENVFNVLSYPATWLREENAKVRTRQLREIAQGKDIGLFSQGAVIGNLTAMLFGAERLTWDRIRERAESAGVSPIELAAELYDMDPTVAQAIIQNPSISDQALDELAKGMPFSRNPGVNMAMEAVVNMGVFIAEAAAVSFLTGGIGTPAILSRLGTLGWGLSAAKGAVQTTGAVIKGTPLQAIPWTLGKAWKLYKAQTVGGLAVRGGEWGLKQVGVWLGDEELVRESDKWLWEMPFSNNPGFMLIDAFTVHPLQKWREMRKGVFQAGDRYAPFVRIEAGVPAISVAGRELRPLHSIDVIGAAIKVDARDARGLNRTIGNLELPELQRYVLDDLGWEPEAVRALFDNPNSPLTVADLKNGLLYMALATVRAARKEFDSYFMAEATAPERTVAWVNEHLHDAVKVLRGQLNGTDDSMVRLFREEFWNRAMLDDASATGSVPLPGTYNGQAAMENFASWLTASKMVRDAHARLGLEGEMVVPGLDERPNIPRLRATAAELAKAYPSRSARVTNEWVQRVAIYNPTLRARLANIPKAGFKRSELDAMIDAAIAEELRVLGADVAGKIDLAPMIEPDATAGQISRGLRIRNAEAVRRLLPIVKGEADIPPGAPPREIVKYVADTLYNGDMEQAIRLPAADLWRRAIDHFAELYEAAAENGRLAGVLDDFGRYVEQQVAEGRVSAEARAVVDDSLNQLRVSLFERVPDDAPPTVRNAVEFDRAQIVDPQTGLIPRIERYLEEPALRQRAAIINDRPALLEPNMVTADLVRLDTIATRIGSNPPMGFSAAAAELLASPDVHPLAKIPSLGEAIDAGAKVSAKDRRFIEGMGTLERLRGTVEELLGEGTEPTPANVTRAGEYVADTQGAFDQILRDLKHRADASTVNAAERTWSPDFRLLLEDIDQYGRNATAGRPNAHLWAIKPTAETPVVPEAARARVNVVDGATEVPELGLGAEELGPGGLRVVVTDENGLARAAIDVLDDRANSKSYIISRVIPDSRKGTRAATTQAVIRAIQTVDVAQPARVGFARPRFTLRINDADGARIALDIKNSTYGDRVSVFVGGSAREANAVQIARFARANKALPIEALDNMEQLDAAAALPGTHRAFVVVEEGQPAYLLVIGPEDVALPAGLPVVQTRPPVGSAPLFGPRQAAFDLTSLDWTTGEEAALRLADEQLLRELHVTTVNLNERVFMRDNPPITFERPAVEAPAPPPEGVVSPPLPEAAQAVEATTAGVTPRVSLAADEALAALEQKVAAARVKVAEMEAAGEHFGILRVGVDEIHELGRLRAERWAAENPLEPGALNTIELADRAVEANLARLASEGYDAASHVKGLEPGALRAKVVDQATRLDADVEQAFLNGVERIWRARAHEALLREIEDGGVPPYLLSMHRIVGEVIPMRWQNKMPFKARQVYNADAQKWETTWEPVPASEFQHYVALTRRALAIATERAKADAEFGKWDRAAQKMYAAAEEMVTEQEKMGAAMAEWEALTPREQAAIRMQQPGYKGVPKPERYEGHTVPELEQIIATANEKIARAKAKRPGAKPYRELAVVRDAQAALDLLTKPEQMRLGAAVGMSVPQANAVLEMVPASDRGVIETVLGALDESGRLSPTVRGHWEEYVASIDAAQRLEKRGRVSAANRPEYEALVAKAGSQYELMRRALATEADFEVRQAKAPPTEWEAPEVAPLLEVPGKPISFPDPFEPTRKVTGRFKVVDLDDLVTSDQPGFPAELQWRQRGQRIASKEQITKLAKDLDPELMMRYESGAEGTPVVGPDNVVIAGNGRVAAMRRSAEIAPGRMEAYGRVLRERAAEFGVDPESLKQGRPVLVREVPVEAMTPEMAYGLNVATGGQSITEGAIYLASRISVEDVKALELGSAGTVQNALSSPRGAEFVQRMLRKLTEQERRSLVDAKGNLNKQGVDLFSAALFGKVMRTPEAQRVVATFFEAADPELARVRQGVMEALGQIAEAQALMDEGLRYPLDIGETLAGAVAKLIDIRQSGQDPQVILKTAGMFSQEEPLVLWLAEVLDASRSQKEIGMFLRRYAQAVMESPDPNQTSMFGDVQPVLADVLRPAVDEINGLRNQVWNERVAESKGGLGLDTQRPSALEPLPKPPGLTGEVELRAADAVAETPAVTASVPTDVPEQIIAEKAPAPAEVRISGANWHKSLASDGKRAEAVVLELTDPRDRAVVEAIVADSAGFREQVLSMARSYEQSGHSGYVRTLADRAAQGDITPAEWVLLKSLQYDKAGRKRPWRVTPGGALEVPSWERTRRAAILDEFYAQADAIDAVREKLVLADVTEPVLRGQTVVVRPAERGALPAEEFANETGFTPDLSEQAAAAERVAAAQEAGAHVLFTTEDAHLAAKVSERMGGPGDVPAGLPRVIEANNPSEAEVIASLEARRLKLEEMRSSIQAELARIEAEGQPPAPVGDPVPPPPLETTVAYFPPELRAAWEQLHAGAVADVMGVPDPRSIGDVVDAIRALEAGWYGAIDDPAVAMRLRDYLLGMARRGLEDGKRSGARKRAAAKTNIVRHGDDGETFTEEFGNYEAEWEEVQRQLIAERVVVDDPSLPPLSGWMGTAYKLTKPPSKSKTTGGGLPPRLVYDDFLKQLDDVVPGLADELTLGRRQDLAGRLRDTRMAHALDMAFGARPEQKLQRAAIGRFQNEVLDMLRASGTYASKDIEVITKQLEDVVYGWRRWLLEEGPKMAGFPIIRRPSLIPWKDLNRIARATLEKENGGTLPTWAEGLDFAQLWRHADNRWRAWLETNAGGLGEYLSSLYQSQPGLWAGYGARGATVMYHTFRFLLDARWLALEATEGPLLTFGRAGPGPTLKGMGFGKRPQPMFFPKEMADFVKRDWAYWMSIESPGYVLRQRERYLLAILEHEQPRHFVDALKRMAERDPELSKTIALMGDDVVGWLRRLDEDFTAAMSRNMELPAREAERIWRPFLERGVLDKAEFEEIVRSRRYTPLPEVEAMIAETAGNPVLQNLYMRLQVVNQQLWNDIAGVVFGQPDRSNFQRLMNHPLIYWPISYQLKATKWLANMLLDRMAGVDTGAAPSVIMQMTVDKHKELMRTDPYYAGQIAANETLLFAAGMILPITPFDIGIGLSPWVRLIIDNTYNRNAVSVGPGYTFFSLAPRLFREQSQEGAWAQSVPVLNELVKEAQRLFPYTIPIAPTGGIAERQAAARYASQLQYQAAKGFELAPGELEQETPPQVPRRLQP